MKHTYRLDFGKTWIEVVVDDEVKDGTVTSNLRGDDIWSKADREWNCAIDAVESMILAHACFGVKVTSAKYMKGIETALEAIANHH